MSPGRVLRGPLSRAALSAAVTEVVVGGSGTALVVTALAPPTPVSRSLIDLLVDELTWLGYDVAVAASRRVVDLDRGVTSVEQMATAAGLTGRTARGSAYEVVDVHADTDVAPVPAHSVLADGRVARAWRDAALRVVVGRAATDLADGYVGCLDPLGQVVAYLPGATWADLSVEVALHLPPQLCLVDALEASAGLDGRGVPSPQPTHTVLVGDDPGLLDTTLATLMGVDRASSRTVSELIRRRGEPAGELRGDRTPWPGFPTPDPGWRSARRRLDDLPQLARLADAVAVAPVGGPGSAADPLLHGLRELYAAWVRAGDQPAARGLGSAWLTGLGALATSIAGWRVGMAKDQVPTVRTSLGFDPSSFDSGDFDHLPTFLGPFATLASAAPVRHGSLRWIRHDGAVVFRTERVIEARFADFVDRVDVAEGISLMADYLGGRRVSVSLDAAGRPVRQAERNVYLPQPNALAIWGQLPIDVCKVELVERSPQAHRLHWRTIASPNGSARSDDGTLSFEAVDQTHVRLVVTGRQEFTVPPGVDLAAIDAVPTLLDSLTTESYRRFFTSTFDNLEACFEGRPFRVGAAPLPADAPLITDVLRAVTDGIRTQLADSGVSAETSTGRPARRSPDTVDLDGFAHFRGRP